MRRVTQVGGTVAIYIWDYVNQMEFLEYFWDAASELNHEVSDIDESKRFSSWNHPYLKTLFNDAGFNNVSTTDIVIHTLFKDFDDYWTPFLGGQGPAPSYMISLDETDRGKLKELLQQRLPFQVDGSISLTSRALAIRGNVSE